MTRIWHLARHDSRLFLMQKENFFFMLGMPVMFMLFFSTVLGGGDSGPAQVSVSLSVIDEDRDFLSSAFVRQLEGQNFEVEPVAPAAADTTAFVRRLRIPGDFSEKILAGEQVTLDLVKEATSSIQFDAAAQVRLHQAQVAFLGNLIRWHQSLPGVEAGGALPSLADVDEVQKGRLLAMIAEPRRVTVQDRHAGRGRPVPRGAGQSIPGMMAMFVVMSVLIGGSESLTKEKYGGTLARLATTPYSRREILAGKLLHLGVVGFIQAVVLMAAGQAIGALGLFGIDFSWGSNVGAVLVLLVPYAFAVGGITLFLSGLFRTTQQAESLAWLFGMIMAAMGGCWWPMEIMPPVARWLAHLMPTYYAMEGLHALITFGRGMGAVVAPSVVLVAFGLLFGWLGSRTMRVAA